MEITKKNGESHLRVTEGHAAVYPEVRLLRHLPAGGLLANASCILALPLLLVVKVYQKTLSPDHGMLKPWYPHGYCKFHPSCSEYAAIILKTEGLIGLPKIINRLLRCRPGVQPAVDQP